MNYFVLTIGILLILLILGSVEYVKMKRDKELVEERLKKTYESYNELIYNNCVLTDKLEKIKALNLIDYENNGYYAELLSTKIN